MKHSGKLHQLFGADDKTIDQLADQCPPDWDMDSIFERSYQSYLAQADTVPEESAEQVISVTESRPRRPYLSILVTAACLTVCFAAVGSMFYMQRNLPSMQDVPEETTAAAESAAPTEARPQETTAPQQVIVAETAPAETQQATDDTSPQETQPTAAETQAAQTQDAQTQTAQAATEPPRQDATKPPAQPATDAPQPDPTEPLVAPAEVPTEPDAADPPPPGGSEQSAETGTGLIEDDAPADSVFRIVRRDDRITFEGAGPDLPFQEGEPSFDNVNLTREPFAEGDPYSRHYKFTDPENGDVYVLHLFRYTGFSMMNFTNDDPNGGFQRIWINGREGFRDSTGGSLFWDHDGGIALMTFTPAQWNTALQMAEHLTFG